MLEIEKKEMSKDQIIDFAKEFGFSLWSTERRYKTLELHFIESRYGINLWVNTDNMEFRFEWKIPLTYLVVKSPQYSPITSKEHFQKMLIQFKKPVRTIFLENETW